MTNHNRSLAYYICIFLILLTHSLHSQELEWAFSNGGHLGEGAWNVEKVPGGVVFLSSDGLEKRSETGEQLWRFDFFELDAFLYSSRPTLRTITVDEVGNVYAQLTFPSNGPGPTTIENIDIPHGDSLIKINPNGELLWCKKLTGSTSPKLIFHDGYVYALGMFNDTINISDTYIFENRENLDCSAGSSENMYARDIFIAKFNSIGQVQNAIVFGGFAHDDLKAVTKDANGNLYLAINYGTSNCTTDETQIHKVDADLRTVWSKTISKEYVEGNGSSVLQPSDIHIGVNGKLYLWAYTAHTVVSDDYRFVNTKFGSTAGLLEYNSDDGSFLNYRSFDGFSSAGLRGYMQDYKGHLVIATTFRETQEFDNGSLSTLNNGEEPILLKVDLNDLSIEHFLHLTGIPQQYHITVKDWSAPICMNGDHLYYSGSFSSDTLNLNTNVALYNNSFNNAQDYFLTKYDLSGVYFATTDEDADGDGVFNTIDICPNTPSGESVDEKGCSSAQKDSDLDGVTDNFDKCPDTSPGMEVDVDGCSQDQIDIDLDGVPDIRDNCEDTKMGATVNEEGCEIVILDSDLFQIEAVGEACKDAGNGRIDIQTEDTSTVYRAVLNGTQEISFTGETQFADLTPGQYELCILAHEVDSDILCYSLRIEEATDLDLDGKVDLTARILKLELSGSSNYKIDFNGDKFETQESFFELKLKNGTNKVLVKTDHLCQDSVSYTVDLDLQIAPNPFTDEIDLSHIKGSGLVKVSIHNLQGLEVYYEIFHPDEPVILKNLTKLNSGIYLLNYSEGQQQFSQKIIRK